MKTRLLVNLIILSVGGFYLATLREGHNWGDDFSMYIRHAKNIVEGRDYRDTGYIYNPHFPSYSHSMYPPVFPLLLVPTYSLFGLNLMAMKAEIVLIFLGCLLLLYLSFRDELDQSYVIAMVAIVGCMPFFWDFKDNVLSDIPFLFFCLLSLFLIDRASKHHHPRLFHVLIISLSIYLAYGTRSVGFLLLVSLISFELLQKRKLSRLSFSISFLTLSLIVIQSLVFRQQGSYFGLLSLNLRTYVNHLKAYPKEVFLLWNNGYSVILQILVFTLVTGLALLGYWIRLRTKKSVYEIFTASYSVTMIFWPYYQGARYIIPVIPLYIFYCLYGIQYIETRSGSRWGRCILLATLTAITISYTGKYTTLDYGPIRNGITAKEATALFDYIRSSTNEGDVFIFRKPRALALFTGRKASVYHRPPQDADLWQFFQQINANYIVVKLSEDQDFFAMFVGRHPDKLKAVYTNPDFTVYRVAYDNRSAGALRQHQAAGQSMDQALLSFP